MKLFAFKPDGHGPGSFFVMAKDLQTAEEKVHELCKKEPDKYYYRYYIGNEDYTVTEYGENEVAVNDND